MFCLWSGAPTVDDAGRQIFRCVNRIENRSCGRTAVGHREWVSICDLANVPRPDPPEVKFRGATKTSDVPCKHLGSVAIEEVGSCCSNETYPIDVGRCALHGRCEIFGRGNARPCCDCDDYLPRPITPAATA